MARLISSLFVAAGLSAGAVLPALAVDASTAMFPTLPALALDPEPTPSIWHGLSVGTELIVAGGKHQKGAGVGGALTASYDHEFANHIVLGIDGSTGYSPSLFGSKYVRGYDFAATDVKVGYDMGRLMPYVTTGVVLAKPRFGPGFGYSASDSINNVFNDTSDLQSAARVGAGVEYALTNNLTVGVGVSVTRSHGGLISPF
ncbi:MULTISPECIES: outer membrane protein [Lichenihabitans]|uniref:outer membrane protein n=1 Tax=Lichenihabitans TaxID=2723776 RepID=UPI0010369E5A|nr:MULTISPECIES: outer membrane beta-barrel protein [Lichenihabitans]UDL94194.1 outer membrane beta-barrel protein [Lichenihabitans sp. PAMC28606]